MSTLKLMIRSHVNTNSLMHLLQGLAAFLDSADVVKLNLRLAHPHSGKVKQSRLRPISMAGSKVPTEDPICALPLARSDALR